PICGIAAHRPPGPVGGRVERVGVRQAPHDVRAHAHRTGDERQVAITGGDCALAGDHHVLPVDPLDREVVVVAVHGHVEAHLAPASAPVLHDGALEQADHDLAGAGGVLLRPVHVPYVIGHAGGVGEEHGEVLVVQLRVVLQALRAGDVYLRDLLADVARARVQGDPHAAVAAVHAQLGEVVAAAHRAQLLACLL